MRLLKKVQGQARQRTSPKTDPGSPGSKLRSALLKQENLTTAGQDERPQFVCRFGSRRKFGKKFLKRKIACRPVEGAAPLKRVDVVISVMTEPSQLNRKTYYCSLLKKKKWILIFYWLRLYRYHDVCNILFQLSGTQTLLNHFIIFHFVVIIKS